LLAAALDRSGDERLMAEKILATTSERFFDPTSGRYMATPAKLPAGIAFRAPAVADPLSAEVLALLAGVDGKTAKLLRLSLLNAIEYDELPPGEVLLALSRSQKD
jgi:hypothetical protein